MPFQYERDDARRLITVRMTGALDPQEFVDATVRQMAEDTWSYGALYDLRLSTDPLPREAQDSVIHHSEIDPVSPQRGPVAVVAADPHIYAAACRFAAVAGPRMKVAVFRELDDARQWVEQHAPR